MKRVKFSSDTKVDLSYLRILLSKHNTTDPEVAFRLEHIEYVVLPSKTSYLAFDYSNLVCFVIEDGYSGRLFWGKYQGKEQFILLKNSKIQEASCSCLIA